MHKLYDVVLHQPNTLYSRIHTADYAKDFSGARRAGWHAILLNRYHEQDKADEWKRRGAIVLDDLMDVVLWLGQSGCKLG